MMRLLRPTCIVCVLALSVAAAAQGFSVLPPWQRNPHPRFQVHDGALWADGAPMPLLYEFTWSAPRNEDLYRYHQQFLGNTHWHPIRFDAQSKPGFAVAMIDEQYRAAARQREFMTLSPAVQSLGAYLKEHPEARMLDNEGKVGRTSASFADPGWRVALADTMTRLAKHVADKPYHLGFYPQDEYAYRMFGGYEQPSLAAFRHWALEHHRTLAALNKRWRTTFVSVDDIAPPRKFEKSVFFADWQTFRQWVQMDYTRVVYQALKKGDPNSMVIWSLPFWGSWRDCASWWSFAPYTDIFMRHGIGYATGIYRLQMLRALQEHTGKPANALCMPPNFNPTFVQYGFMLDGPRTGLSHVCVGGSESHAYYMGAADSDNGWKRREPMYTKSRALNDLVRLLGPTYLLSRRDPPPVGVFIEDRTVLLNGAGLTAVNGILNLLSDLNIEVDIFSENQVGDLSRFKAVFAGSYARCMTEELSAKFKRFVDDGGALFLTAGAFAADWFNRDVGSPGFGWERLMGSATVSKVSSLRLVEANAPPGAPSTLPVAGVTRVLSGGEVKPLALSDRGAPVIVRHGNVFYFGVDPGSVYAAGYSDDFLGVKRERNQQLMDEQAGFFFDHDISNAELLKLGEHRAYARLLQLLLAEFGIGPQLRLSGPGRVPGALRARLLHHGRDHLVCLANRVVEPGTDHHTTPPRQYHRVHRNMTLRVALADMPQFAVQLPFAESSPLTSSPLPRHPATARGNSTVGQLWNSSSANGVRSLPRLLPLKRQGEECVVELPELVDVATILLTSDYRPLLGMGLDQRAVTAGERVRVLGRIVNPSPRRLRGAVWLDAAAPLRSAARVEVNLEPGQQRDFSGEVTVPAQASPGYYLLQWVGEFNGRQFTSTSLELEVVTDLRLEVVRDKLTRFPLEEHGSTVEVQATSNLPSPLDLLMEIDIPPGYRAEPAQQHLRCRQRAQTVTGRATIQATGKAPPVSYATVRMSARVRGKPFIFERKLRLARGAVTYREPKSVRYAAAEESRHDAQLVVLENPKIKATFIEAIGVLHELILNETGTDHLAEGDYPFGFTWYSGPSGWKLTNLSGPGDRVSAAFAATAKGGHRIRMTATLDADDDFVQLDYDTDDLPAGYGAFYLMSRLSKTGEQDTMVVPLKSGERRMKWKSGGQVKATVDQLSGNWLAVHSAEKDETLGVSFDIPALRNVLCRSRSSSWHYFIFSLQPKPPGQMRFRIGAAKGNQRPPAFH